MSTKIDPPKKSWKPLPNPIKYKEVSLELTWKANNKSTRQAIEQQATAEGLSPTEWLHDLIASSLAALAEQTAVTNDGQYLCAADAKDWYGPPTA